MGATDKLIRSIIGIIIAILYYSGIITGTLAIVLLAFAIIFLLTSFISFCPLYTTFRHKHQ
ncbi:YgaP family membrane protein [Flavobacterium taihuense]